MRIIQIIVFLLIVPSLISCSAIDYQSLKECSSTGDFTAIPEGADLPYATVESIPAPVWNTDNTWYAFVTHVNCEKIADPWQMVRIPAKELKVRVKFNPEASSLNSVYPGVSEEFENVAQWLAFTPKAGEKYNLHVKTLTRWDMAYWITSEDGSLIAHTENFKSSFIEDYNN